LFSGRMPRTEQPVYYNVCQQIGVESNEHQGRDPTRQPVSPPAVQAECTLRREQRAAQQRVIMNQLNLRSCRLGCLAFRYRTWRSAFRHERSTLNGALPDASGLRTEESSWPHQVRWRPLCTSWWPASCLSLDTAAGRPNSGTFRGRCVKAESMQESWIWS
jgi:hypothetical protein